METKCFPTGNFFFFLFVKGVKVSHHIFMVACLVTFTEHTVLDEKANSLNCEEKALNQSNKDLRNLSKILYNSLKIVYITL